MKLEISWLWLEYCAAHFINSGRCWWWRWLSLIGEVLLLDLYARVFYLLGCGQMCKRNDKVHDGKATKGKLLFKFPLTSWYTHDDTDTYLFSRLMFISNTHTLTPHSHFHSASLSLHHQQHTYEWTADQLDVFGQHTRQQLQAENRLIW